MTIIVAGSVNLDMIARVPRLPRPGETIAGLDYATAPGGKGANQALAARRAGAPVVMVGAVGADANAAPALALLEAAGVDLTPVTRLGDRTPTGVAMILVDDGTGENEIIVIAGANGTVDAGHADGVALGVGDVVLLQMEVPAAANAAFIAQAGQAGATSILNIAPYGEAAPDLAARADITVANESEFDLLADALALTGATRQDKATAFVAQTGKRIIVTLGPDGAFAATADGIVSVTAPAITPVDTVGAGDTFCGYLGAALHEGKALDAAMALACKAGALACLARGAQPAIPVRADVDGF